jgi:hypothetical protein
MFRYLTYFVTDLEATLVIKRLISKKRSVEKSLEDEGMHLRIQFNLLIQCTFYFRPASRNYNQYTAY